VLDWPSFESQSGLTLRTIIVQLLTTDDEYTGIADSMVVPYNKRKDRTPPFRRNHFL
jgi:hypothetical protein